MLLALLAKLAVLSLVLSSILKFGATLLITWPLAVTGTFTYLNQLNSCNSSVRPMIPILQVGKTEVHRD